MNKLLSLVLLWVLMFSMQAYSQKALGTIKEPDGSILSFENQNDIQKIQASNSDFERTDLISVLGEQSLRWDWEKGSNLELPLFNYYSQKERLSPFDKNQCLVVWIYNEHPSSGYLNLQLMGDNLDPISCHFFLDYTGWRTAHIPLSQMQGHVPQKGEFAKYKRLKIEVPSDQPIQSGRFFIDDVYTTMIDARHPSADFQAPYVKAFFNGGTYVTQWMNQPKLPAKADLKIKQIPVTRDDVKAFEELYENEFAEITWGFYHKGLDKNSFHAIVNNFNALKIEETEFDGRTYIQAPYIALKGQGLPQNIIEKNKTSGKFITVKEFQGVLWALAKGYFRCNVDSLKNELKERFVLATKAYLQSGWAAGSNMGALHHYGYASREIAPSFFIMKDVLRDAGLLVEVAASLNWYSVAHVVNNPDHTMPDLDLFNTLLYSHFLASMMRPEKEDAARHAILLSQWLSRTFADHTKHGGFKYDGTAWHHWGHYPAYCNGAIDDAVRVANKLTDAGFPLTSQGHKALQKAVKTIMLYSQGNVIPRSLSGRHPLTGSHENFIHADYTRTFVQMSPIDSSLLALYNYHTGNEKVEGHWTLPYSGLNLHRRNDYLVAVRGFGIYNWGSEIYNFNRFGRYQSYGTIDILYKNVNELPYKGYDWNLNPGTTVTYLPMEELESPLPVFMVKSFSRFANGVKDKEGKNGAHGFILDESVLINIDPGYEEVFTKEKLKARKSTFFLDDIVLCLGSGISGEHPEAPVYTVLTQQAKSDQSVLVEDNIQEFPCSLELSGEKMMYDGSKNAYVVFGQNNKVKVEFGEQISRGDECTFNEARRPQRSEKGEKVNLRREPQTKGDFFTAVIDHGIEPADERYTYAIIPGLTEREYLIRARHLLNHPELYFEIIAQRNGLHAVKDIRNGTETYICYEAQDMIPHVSLHEVSDPCLLMLKEEESQNLNVSVALPDLHQTAFSREQKHKSWNSQPHLLELSFEGSWEIEPGTSELISMQPDKHLTKIIIKARHGDSYGFRIFKSEL